jgi:6-phosphogluconolactonase
MREGRVLRSLALGIAGCLLAGLAAGCKGNDEETAGHPVLYVAGEQNLTWYAFDSGDGTLTKNGSIPFDLTVAYLAASADGKFLHALVRTNPPDENAIIAAKTLLEGYVVSYSINQTSGKLTEVSRVYSGGGRPTYITFDKTGKYVLVANNYGHLPGQGHSIAVFKVKADGALAEAHQTLMSGFTDPPAGMTEPVPFVRSHQIRVHPSNKYVFVPNIDSDTVSQFRFDEKTGTLTPNDPPFVKLTGGEGNEPFTAPPGIYFGPRHLDFHPNGKWIYLSNEYSALVVAFALTASGTLEQMGDPVRGVPAAFDGGKWQSEVRVHPSGHFVYAGERDKPATPPNTMHVRQDSMAIFKVNANTGALSLMANEPTEKTPRNFALDPAGSWLVVGNQDSHTLMTFRIKADGKLEMVSETKDQHAPYVHLFVTLP